MKTVLNNKKAHLLKMGFKFLQENKDSIDVVDIKWKVYAMAHLVMIIYKEKEI